MILSLFHFAEGVLVFLIILMILVAAHEYGHYIFARLFNMGVEEFSIGMFGKQPLVTWMKRKYRLPVRPGEDPYKHSVSTGSAMEGGGLNIQEPVVLDGPNGMMLEETTVFTVRPWPIGGFVRIKGMMPEEDGSEVQIPGGFYSKPPWQRLAVLLAGPVFSILAGVIVMIPWFMVIGNVTSSNAPVIGSVIPGDPAAKAGLKEGDRILSIDGKPVDNFYQVIATVRDSAGKPLNFVYERDHKDLAATVVPFLQQDPTLVLGPDLEPTGEIRKQALMGVERKPIFQRVAFGEAVSLAVRIPIQNLRAIASIFHEPDAAKKTVSGPGGMLMLTTDAVQQGFFSVVGLAATISIALGIFNLLPVYPMDGGQMVVAIAELLRGGRRLSIRVQTVMGTVGLGLLALMAIGAITVDIGRWTEKPAPNGPPMPAKEPKK
jgi:regulator of sigma E protease